MTHLFVAFTDFFILLQTSASQLVQQVQAERSKQYFLVNEAAAAQAAQQAAAVASNSASYSSAARITPASSKQPTSGSSSAASAASIVSRADAPAVIINERDRQQMAMKMLTAQSVIDAIITQSIQGNPAAAAAAVSSGGHEAAAAHKLSQEEMVKAARAQLEQQQAQQQHHAQQHQAASEAAAAAAAAARSSSRPPSSHERPSLPPDMVLNKELSITPAPTGTKAEEYLKQRQIMITTSATLTPTSSAAPTRVSDERQIIRVAQAMSPAKVSAAEAAIEAARKATSPPNGDQPPPGIMTLDYVKNKIVEAMKKQGEEDPATSTSTATKRASPDMASEDASSPKKKKTEDEAPATAQPPVDSPGSPGDMVIDESAQESTPKAASPASASAPTTASNPPTSEAAVTPVSSAAQPVNSKYEPLSDDE